MRKREEIESDPKHYDALSLEVLLDMRALLACKPGEAITKQPKAKRKKASKGK